MRPGDKKAHLEAQRFFSGAHTEREVRLCFLCCLFLTYRGSRILESSFVFPRLERIAGIEVSAVCRLNEQLRLRHIWGVAAPQGLLARSSWICSLLLSLFGLHPALFSRCFLPSGQFEVVSGLNVSSLRANENIPAEKVTTSILHNYPGQRASFRGETLCSAVKPPFYDRV